VTRSVSSANVRLANSSGWPIAVADTRAARWRPAIGGVHRTEMPAWAPAWITEGDARDIPHEPPALSVMRSPPPPRGREFTLKPVSALDHGRQRPPRRSGVPALASSCLLDVHDPTSAAAHATTRRAGRASSTAATRSGGLHARSGRYHPGDEQNAWDLGHGIPPGGV
jgi:hypothetical protein